MTELHSPAAYLVRLPGEKPHTRHGFPASERYMGQSAAHDLKDHVNW